MRGHDGDCQGNVGAGDTHDEENRAIEMERKMIRNQLNEEQMRVCVT